MTDFNCECTYCGHQFVLPAFYFANSIKDPECPKCGDKNLKIKKVDNSTHDVFGYNYVPGDKRNQ